MAHRTLRIVLVFSLLLALSPRQVLGFSCCHRQLSPSYASPAAVPHHCPCCCDNSSNEEEDATPSPKGVPVPCPCGVEWCCGAGYVPLSLPISSAPILERMPETALSYLSIQPSDGHHPRIEEPPRHF